MSKKTLALIAGLTVLTVILVILALKTGPKTPGNKPSDSEVAVSTSPTPRMQPKTTLSLSPNPVTISGGTATVDVMIDTADNAVAGVQFDLRYDPKVFNITSVKLGSFFAGASVLNNTTDAAKGTVTYFISLTPAQIRSPKSGTGPIATILLTKKSTAPSSGTSPLTLEHIEVSGLPQDAGGFSLLKSATGTTVNLTNTASPSGR